MVAAFVAWRLLASGGLDPGTLGSGVEAPVLAAIPAIVGIAVAAIALTIVPVVLRRLAGSRRHRSIPIRLALLSLARDPVRPAATITLLAFGIGGLVFGVVDASTLRRGMADQAAFAVGMDLRVTEAPSGLTLTTTVAPFDRYAGLGPGVEAFAVGHAAASAGPAGDLTLIGLSPDALPRLRGWRADLGGDPAELAAAIDVSGDFEVPGVPLDPGATEVAVTVTHQGDPVYLSAVIGTPDGDATRVFLGTLKGGRETLRAPLPEGAEDGRVIGLIIGEGRLIAGSEHAAGLAQATLAFEGYDLLTGSEPVAVEVSGVREAVFRAPLATDDLILPAIVGPALADAAAATADGVLDLTLADRPLTRIRVAGVLPRMPGAPGAGPDFAIVDLDPMLTALDGAAPGAGRPDEAWIRVDDPARVETVRSALGQPPFRTATIRSRPGLEAAAAGDPFSSSILAAFAAAGAAGLLLAALGLALGALADVRDETGELRDLEAQGVGPRALRRQVGARTMLLAVGGTAAGLAMGLGLAAVVTGALGVGADGTVPVPPLVLDLPWSGILVAAAVPLIAAAVLAGDRRRWRLPGIGPDPGSGMTAGEIDGRGLIAVHPGGGGPVAALRGLDLEVATGEIVAIVGPSGSGKTTLLRLLAGADRPTAGALSVHGLALDRATPAEVRAHRRTVVATVDQHYRRALSPYLPAAEIVALPLAARGVPPEARARRVAELLGALGLGDRGAAHLGELSGGEQQRVAVAAALAPRPLILLADEPTGELDAESTAELLRLLRDVIRAEGATAVVVTHDPSVEAIADRVVVLEDGRAVARRDGPPGTPERPVVDAAGWRAPEATWRHHPATISAANGKASAAASDPATVRPAADPGAAAVLRGVIRRYGPTGHRLTALDGIDADVAARGVHVLTGPSGSGKSTLLRIVGGLDRPDAGSVVVLGTDLASLDRDALAAFRAAHVGVAEQARGLVPFLDIRENLAIAAALHAPRSSTSGDAASAQAANLDELLERLGLAGLAGRRPSELSAGERTRAAIGRALVGGPALLLLDEPTATLDRVTAARIGTLLHDLARDRSVLVATHDPALVDVADDRLDLHRRVAPAAG